MAPHGTQQRLLLLQLAVLLVGCCCTLPPPAERRQPELITGPAAAPPAAAAAALSTWTDGRHIGKAGVGLGGGCSFFGSAGTDYQDENVSVVTIRSGPPFASCCAACSAWNRNRRHNTSAGNCVIGVVYGAGTHSHPRLPTACALKAGSTKPVVSGGVTAVKPSGPPPPPPTPPTPPVAAFRFASSHGDGMVLQASPSRSQVWGMCPAGASVAVRFRGATVKASVNGTLWSAQLPATASSMTETHTITATSAEATISIRGVLFGAPSLFHPIRPFPAPFTRVFKERV
jgi:hypothetical protein